MLSACASFGQTKKAFLKAADEAMQDKNYYGALLWYNEVLEFDEGDTSTIFKVAEAARNFQAYEEAAKNYTLLVDSLGSDKHPQSAYYAAQMYQRLGDYDNAKAYYNIYLSEYSDSDEMKEADTEAQLTDIEYALEHMEVIDKSATISEPDGSINTNYSDFGATILDDDLYYTTMSYNEENTENDPARSISKLHLMKGDSSGMLIEGDINETDLLVAHSTFTTDRFTLFYTVCEYLNDEDVRCDIYSRPVNADGGFGEQTKLLAPINIDSFTNTQPHVAFDSTLMKDVLYFVSDRNGGKGELDIYKATIFDNGSLGEPENVEWLNTEGNDATPFYHRRSNTMYYATDGRQGLGGYDVYSVNLNNLNEVTHLRSPINGSYHDLYYSINDNSEKGYFSSNREGASYIDSELKACCFDIFKVEYDEVILEFNALVFDDFTRESLNGATLTLLDADTGEVLEVITNADANDFYFKLERDKNYQIVVDRPFYNSQTLDISTVGITTSKNFEREIYLKTDRMQLKLEMFNKRTKEELAGVQIRIKNLTTGEIDTIAVNEDGNDFVFYPEIGYKYEIEASKFGFVTSTEIVDLTGVTEPGLIEKKMYLEVFDIEDYTPVTVYFNNDYPNPRSKSTDSDKIYGNLYNDYLREKVNYIDSYTSKLAGQGKIDARNELDAFFEGDVVGGYDKLKRFMRALKKELELGRSLELAIKGYASPLADTRYNLALGSRRVSSVENELLNYEGGIFRSYVQSGQLIINDISFGEETSPSDVSDQVRDKRNSIFSVRASKERRVQIVRIEDQ